MSRRAKEIVEEHALMSECISCNHEDVPSDCSKSKRPCKHHCNHSWSHDECCWCGEVFGEEGLEGEESFEHWKGRAAAYWKEINPEMEGDLFASADLLDIAASAQIAFESGETPKSFIQEAFADEIAESDDEE
jgi:hypothetical protein